MPHLRAPHVLEALARAVAAAGTLLCAGLGAHMAFGPMRGAWHGRAGERAAIAAACGAMAGAGGSATLALRAPAGTAAQAAAVLASALGLACAVWAWTANRAPAHRAGPRAHRRTSVAGWAWLAAAAGLALAGTSRAIAEAGWLSADAAVEVAHRAAGAAWLGGIAAIACALGTLEGPRLAAVVRRFSTAAIVAVAAVTVTGLYAAAPVLASPAAAIGTAYGRALAAKMGLVAALVALGAWNRFGAAPRLERGAARRTLGWPLVAELVALGAVLVAAGVMGAAAGPVP